MAECIVFDEEFYAAVMARVAEMTEKSVDLKDIKRSTDLFFYMLAVDTNRATLEDLPVASCGLLIELCALSYVITSDDLVAYQARQEGDIDLSGQEVRAITLGDTRVEYTSKSGSGNNATHAGDVMKMRELDLYDRLVRRLRQVAW